MRRSRTRHQGALMPRRTAGAICLAHEGCAQRVWLIAGGSERGRMRSDPRCDEADLRPLLDAHGGPVDFRGWYLGRLAEAEAARGPARRDRRGPVPGGLAQFVV